MNKTTPSTDHRSTCRPQRQCHDTAVNAHNGIPLISFSGLKGVGAMALVASLLLCLSLLGCAATPTPAGPASIAVWDLEALGDMNAAQTAMGAMLAARIADRLGQSPDFQVVEREKLMRLLEEQKLGASQLVDERTRLRLGRIIGCRQMVFGAYQLLGDTMRLDLRMVDVSSSKVTRTADGTVPAHDVAAWLDTADAAAGALIQP